MDKIRNFLIILLVVVLCGIAYQVWSGDGNEKVSDVETESVVETPAATATPSVEEITYQKAEELFAQGMYQEAADFFYEIKTYGDAIDRYHEAKYQIGKEYYEAKKWKKAKKAFTELSGYKDSDTLVKKCQKKIKKAEECLRVEYVVNQSKRHESGNYFYNGKGTLSFAEDIPLDDWVGFGGKYVTYTIPQSYIIFRLRNTGKKTLKNVKLQLAFDGVFLKDVSGEFEGMDHLHGLGGYAGAKWETYQNLAAGEETELIDFEMSQAYFENGETGTLTLTVSADNYAARKYKIALKLD